MGFLKIPSHSEGMSEYWDRDGFWMARKFWQAIYQKTWWDFQKSRQDFSGQFFWLEKPVRISVANFFWLEKPVTVCCQITLAAKTVTHFDRHSRQCALLTIWRQKRCRGKTRHAFDLQKKCRAKPVTRGLKKSCKNKACGPFGWQEYQTKPVALLACKEMHLQNSSHFELAKKCTGKLTPSLYKKKAGGCKNTCFWHFLVGI